MYAWNPRKNYREIWKILIKGIYKKSTLFLIYFKNYRYCRYTCNPRKFENPALQFPRKVPVNPCKHLQCTVSCTRANAFPVFYRNNFNIRFLEFCNIFALFCERKAIIILFSTSSGSFAKIDSKLLLSVLSTVETYAAVDCGAVGHRHTDRF